MPGQNKNARMAILVVKVYFRRSEPGWPKLGAWSSQPWLSGHQRRLRVKKDQGQETQRSKDTHSDVDTSPSARSADAASTTPDDRHDEDPTASVKAGVQPQTGHDEEGQQPRQPGITLAEEYSWLDDPEDQRIERLMDLVAEEVTWVYVGLRGAGYLDPAEQNAVRDMLVRGEHWRKVANTVVRQREVADAGFVGAG